MPLNQLVRIINLVTLVLFWAKPVALETTLNVGTTLFHPNDVGRPCWSDEEMALLASRHVLQDIVPLNNMDTSNERYITAVLEFACICVSEVRSKTQGTVRVLLLKSLADALGGYLHTYMLPVTKQSFYAGNVPYMQVRRLFSLMEEVKSVLHTDGQHWRPPSQYKVLPSNPANASAANVTSAQRDVACAQLITFGRSGAPRVPVPFLDDDKIPHSLALPLKVSVLVSMDSPTAESIFVTFYDTATQCLARTPEAESFKTKVQTWLHSTVLPRLDDEQWYPAFGGVLRLTTANISHKLQPNTSRPLGTKPKPTSFGGFFSRLSPGTMIGLLIASAICVWVKVALCFLCIRCCRNRRKDKVDRKPSNESVSQSSSVINTLVKLFSSMEQVEKDSSVDPENPPSDKDSRVSLKSSDSSLTSYQPTPSYLGQLEKEDSPLVTDEEAKNSKSPKNVKKR